MLQLNHVTKIYQSDEMVQTAVDGVSLNLRDNEFVAILGPSGSGKTTLLNVIGGLDRYDCGDLVIDGISTRMYDDRDWDAYRNHRIGFVFQSYNLIPHQSILANVEMSLTIGGVSKAERRSRAMEALNKVGLGGQARKRPNQLSGGQMQRVAIARALVNDPQILLADEPTGALDEKTGITVMDLLKEVAADRLVVMVTHNPELAERYATRIVRMRDGRVVEDTDPYIPKEMNQALVADESTDQEVQVISHKKKKRRERKPSMSFKTALHLSLNNLRTKMGRTLLTAAAGSIGIVGIALIVSLSTGVNQYITDVQKETMASYPITIEAQSVDMQAVMTPDATDEVDHELDMVYNGSGDLESRAQLAGNSITNNLSKFKTYLDKAGCPLMQYVGEAGVVYSYDTAFDIFAYDPNGELLNMDGSSLGVESSSDTDVMAVAGFSQGSGSNFEQLIPSENGMVSDVVTQTYDVVYGRWPSDYNEVVLAVDENNEISTQVLYELGYLSAEEYRDLDGRIEDGKDVTIDEVSLEYSQICGHEFYLLPRAQRYYQQESGAWCLMDESDASLLGNATKLRVVGVVRPKANVENPLIGSTVGYTQALTEHIMEETNDSRVVHEQQDRSDVDVLTGMRFEPQGTSEKAEDFVQYMSTLPNADKASIATDLLNDVYTGNEDALEYLAGLSEEDMLAQYDSYIGGEHDEALLATYYDRYAAAELHTYDQNMKTFGVVDEDVPSAISIYADTFESKDAITTCIDNYNAGVRLADRITYNDYVAMLMSSITTVVNVISYVLIAFVAVSLLVSSVMVGIIIYISVIERTKEIGILRALGASKRNISQVFNAETIIIGLCSGIIGVTVAALAIIPSNILIHNLVGSDAVNAALQVPVALALVALSVGLTFIGGIIPASKASHKDPVAALRSE